MKLKNKLLPLVGTAAIVATATPLALTSCKSSNVEMVDISKSYVPSYEPHVAASLGQHGANQEYFGSIKTTPSIFTEDYIYGKFLQIHENIEEWNTQHDGSTKINSLKVGISNPTFSSVDIAYPGEKTLTYPTITTTFKVEFDITQEYVDTEDQTYHSINRIFTCSTDYKNMPFYAQPDSYKTDAGDVGYWYLSVPYWDDAPWVYNYNMSNWSIDYTCESKMTTKEVRFAQGATEKTKEGSKSGTISTPADMDAMFGDSGRMPHELFELLPSAITLGFASHFMSNITQIPELNSRGLMETSIVSPISTDIETVKLGTIYDGDEYSVDFDSAAVLMTSAMESMLTDSTPKGTIKLYADIVDGEASGNITLQEITESETTKSTLEITAGTVLDIESDDNRQEGTTDTDWEGYVGYGLPAATLSPAKSSTTAGEKTYKFALPKYIVVQVELEGYEIEPQKVYLNSDSTDITVTFEEE